MLSATLAAILAGTTPPAAYPIPPRPLRLLVQESEFIVTARVSEAGPRTKARMLDEEKVRFGAWDVVVLEIDELVKGDPGRATIEQVNYGWICPTPAHYVPGTRVLAFLDREKEGDGFCTPALSYGAKTLDDTALAVYLLRIREQLAIEEMPEDDLRLAAQVEWLVRCAEDPATCWEGAYELARTGDFMSHYERDQGLQDFARHLTSEQRARLSKAFLLACEFQRGEQCLEELLRDDDDPKLLAWLVSQLRAHHEEVEKNGYSVSRTLIERIARRDPRPAVQELAAGFAARQKYGDLGDDGPGRLQIARELLALY